MREYSTFRTQSDYAVPLLEVLADMPGHQAAKRAVLSEIERRHGELIPPEHRENVPTGTVVRWANWVAWLRFDLIQLGLMEAPAFGIWGISEAGLEWLLRNPTATRIAPTSRPRRSRPRKQKPKPAAKGHAARSPRGERDHEQRALDIYRREVRAVREFLAGRGARPSDERLCDMVQFCYTFELHTEGHHLFLLVDPKAVNDWLYQRTARLARVCSLKARS